MLAMQSGKGNPVSTTGQCCAARMCFGLEMLSCRHGDYITCCRLLTSVVMMASVAADCQRAGALCVCVLDSCKALTS